MKMVLFKYFKMKTNLLFVKIASHQFLSFKDTFLEVSGMHWRAESPSSCCSASWIGFSWARFHDWGWQMAVVPGWIYSYLTHFIFLTSLICFSACPTAPLPSSFHYSSQTFPLLSTHIFQNFSFTLHLCIPHGSLNLAPFIRNTLPTLPSHSLNYICKLLLYILTLFLWMSGSSLTLSLDLMVHSFPSDLHLCLLFRNI